MDGIIDEQLLSRLTPHILKLQNQSRAPITLYINSSGGQVSIMQRILQLLRMPDQNGAPACEIITVVTNKAQSAAADLLSSGDYAIALPSSRILYHGVRTAAPSFGPLTAERTTLLAHLLRLTNDAYAMELAQRTEQRFLFRFLIMRNSFPALREKIRKNLSDLDSFMELLKVMLSPRAVKVLMKAQERYARYQPLLEKLIAKKQVGPNKPAKIEAARLKAIVDFEVATNKDDVTWTFKDGGVTRLVEDFYLLTEYFEGQQNERLKQWCLKIGRFSLTKEELNEIDLIADEKAREERMIEKLHTPTQPLWMFFVALCHALQEDDNELTETDCYWFGLVDEVWGDASLVTPRLFAEYVEDQPAKHGTNEKAEAKSEEKQGAAAGA